MYRIGGSVFQRMMRPLLVVNIYCFTHHFPRLRQILRALQQQLSFQNPVHPLRQRILVTVFFTMETP